MQASIFFALFLSPTFDYRIIPNGIVTLRPNVTLKSDCPPHQRAAVTPLSRQRGVTRSSHGSQKTGESQPLSRSEFSQIEIYANALLLVTLNGTLHPAKDCT